MIRLSKLKFLSAQHKLKFKKTHNKACHCEGLKCRDKRSWIVKASRERIQDHEKKENKNSQQQENEQKNSKHLKPGVHNPLGAVDSYQSVAC